MESVLLGAGVTAGNGTVMVLAIKVLTSLKRSVEKFKETSPTKIIANYDKPEHCGIGLFMAVIFLRGYSTKITSKILHYGFQLLAVCSMAYTNSSLDARMK